MAYIYLAFGQRRQSLHGSAGKPHGFGIGSIDSHSKRRRGERAHKNIAHIGFGVGNYIVGALAHHSQNTGCGKQMPQTGNVSTCGAGKTAGGAISGLDLHTKYFSTLATHNSAHRARHRRDKSNRRKPLAMQQNTATFHNVAGLHVGLGLEARIIVGRYGHNTRRNTAGGLCRFHRTGDRQIVAFSYFDSHD